MACNGILEMFSSLLRLRDTPINRSSDSLTSQDTYTSIFLKGHLSLSYGLELWCSIVSPPHRVNPILFCVIDMYYHLLMNH